MSRLVLFAHRMIRIFDMYFSIVRRRAAWASRERESASLMITTTLIKLNRETEQYENADLWTAVWHSSRPAEFVRFPSRVLGWLLGRSSLPRYIQGIWFFSCIALRGCLLHTWEWSQYDNCFAQYSLPTSVLMVIGTLVGQFSTTIQSINNQRLQSRKKKRGTWTFSTPGPNSCLRVHVIRVFFPAPEGP